jgi:hypothetical protein
VCADLVVVPRVFEIQREYEVAAARVIGRDDSAAPCFCAYSYRSTKLCCDDNDVFYEATIYCEELSAWRLRDGRWLSWRLVVTGDDDGEKAGVRYALSEKMPR